MMKRCLSLWIAVALLLCLAACASQEETAAPAQTPEAAEPLPEPVPDAPKEDAPKPAAQPTTEETSGEKAPDEEAPETSAPETPETTEAPAPTETPASIEPTPATPETPAAPETPAPETPAPVQETPPASEPETPETPAASTATAADAQAFIGQDVNNLYAAIGRPADSYYEYSCSGPGDDGLLYYDGFTVFTYVENGVETVIDAEAD